MSSNESSTGGPTKKAPTPRPTDQMRAEIRLHRLIDAGRDPVDPGQDRGTEDDRDHGVAGEELLAAVEDPDPHGPQRTAGGQQRPARDEADQPAEDSAAGRAQEGDGHDRPQVQLVLCREYARGEQDRLTGTWQPHPADPRSHGDSGVVDRGAAESMAQEVQVEMEVKVQMDVQERQRQGTQIERAEHRREQGKGLWDGWEHSGDPATRAGPAAPVSGGSPADHRRITGGADRTASGPQRCPPGQCAAARDRRRSRAMTLSIIVSYDGTANDDDALALARMLAPAGASLALAYVRHSLEYDPRREEIGSHDAERRLQQGAEWLQEPEIARHVVVDPSTSAGLARLAGRTGGLADPVRLRLSHRSRAR